MYTQGIHRVYSKDTQNSRKQQKSRRKQKTAEKASERLPAAKRLGVDDSSTFWHQNCLKR